MFFKSCIFTMVVVAANTLLLTSARAYTNEGVKKINAQIVIVLAQKEGLVISDLERTVKKGLLKLKNSNRKEFEKKISRSLENDSIYQGYLLEVQDGLKQVERAKTIAKYELYKSVENNWQDLKLTAINTLAEESFKKFRRKLIADLNKITYLKKDELGYHFVADYWGQVTLGKNFNSVIWKIHFNTKNDKNRLEEGAEKIQIDGGSDSDMGYEEPIEDMD